MSDMLLLPKESLLLQFSKAAKFFVVVELTSSDIVCVKSNLASYPSLIVVKELAGPLSLEFPRSRERPYERLRLRFLSRSYERDLLSLE